MPDPDRQAASLLECIARHDEAAMAEFYRTFARQVYAFALRQAGDPGDAEDADRARGARSPRGMNRCPPDSPPTSRC